jgi:hypothetical protein
MGKVNSLEGGSERMGSIPEEAADRPGLAVD